jgi:hypothetical protein
VKDLIDNHRANIAKAGVALAEAISVATQDYSAAVAASEAALEVAIEQRVAAFNGARAELAKEPAEKLVSTSELKTALESLDDKPRDADSDNAP